MIATHTFGLETDGSGDADDTTYPLNGLLQGIRVEYADSPAATTDLTISEVNGMQRTILTLTDTNTPATYNPHADAQDTTGSGLTVPVPFAINGPLRLLVAGASADTPAAVVVRVQMLED